MEELLSLQAMHDITTGKDLFSKVVETINNFEVQKKLSTIAADGAPAMVGVKKGLTALVKKETSHLGLH